MRALFLTALATAFLWLSSGAQPATTSSLAPLSSPDDLAELIRTGDPLVLDIRGDKVEDGRIPGAVSAPYGSFRGPKENPGELLSDARFTEVFRSLGIEEDRPTVIVHQGRDETDFEAAARVYWTLKSAGVQNISILNGGMNAWLATGTPAVQKTASDPSPSDFTVTLSDRWLATREDVQAIVNGERSGRLVDARPASFYNGEQAHPAAARPGTIPQSEYFTHSGWFSGGPAIVDAAAARKLAADNGFRQDEALVSFCNTGHWASTNWFALSELAGIENVKLYPESLVGWSNAGLPMANTPGLIQTFINRIKQAL